MLRQNHFARGVRTLGQIKFACTVSFPKISSASIPRTASSKVVVSCTPQCFLFTSDPSSALVFFFLAALPLAGGADVATAKGDAGVEGDADLGMADLGRRPRGCLGGM